MQKTLQDSAMALYIKNQDSLFESRNDFLGNGINEPDYTFLKAIYKKDTLYLRSIISAGKSQSTDTAFATFWNNNIPNLKTLRCTEAYQFDYSETFCNFVYVITIYKINDSIKLSKRIMRHVSNDENDFPKFELHQQEEKSLSVESWEKFLKGIELADYWNLKSRDNRCVLDPSILSVKGIRKTSETAIITDIKSVQRQVFRRTALYQSFLQVLKFASIGKVCDDR